MPGAARGRAGCRPRRPRSRSRAASIHCRPSDARAVGAAASDSRSERASRRRRSRSRPPPQSGLRSRGSGRARQRTRTGAAPSSTSDSTRSRKAGAAQCTSSSTTSSGGLLSKPPRRRRAAHAVSSGRPGSPLRDGPRRQPAASCAPAVAGSSCDRAKPSTEAGERAGAPGEARTSGPAPRRAHRPKTGSASTKTSAPSTRSRGASFRSRGPEDGDEVGPPSPRRARTDAERSARARVRGRRRRLEAAEQRRRLAGPRVESHEPSCEPSRSRRVAQAATCGVRRRTWSRVRRSRRLAASSTGGPDTSG